MSMFITFSKCQAVNMVTLEESTQNSFLTVLSYYLMFRVFLRFRIGLDGSGIFPTSCQMLTYFQSKNFHFGVSLWCLACMTFLASIIMVINRGSCWTVAVSILVAALYVHVVNVVCLIHGNKSLQELLRINLRFVEVGDDHREAMFYYHCKEQPRKVDF